PVFSVLISRNTLLVFFFLLIRPPPCSTLFPYTTLFRSILLAGVAGALIGLPALRVGGFYLAMVTAYAALAVPAAVTVFAKQTGGDRKSTRLNSSHQIISYAVFCLKKKKHTKPQLQRHTQ